MKYLCSFPEDFFSFQLKISCCFIYIGNVGWFFKALLNMIVLLNFSNFQKSNLWIFIFLFWSLLLVHSVHFRRLSDLILSVLMYRWTNDGLLEWFWIELPASQVNQAHVSQEWMTLELQTPVFRFCGTQCSETKFIKSVRNIINQNIILLWSLLQICLTYIIKVTSPKVLCICYRNFFVCFIQCKIYHFRHSDLT